jgi:hypothetical protein
MTARIGLGRVSETVVTGFFIGARDDWMHERNLYRKCHRANPSKLFSLIIGSGTIRATTYAAYSQRGHTVSDVRQVRGGFQPRIATLNGLANCKPRPAPAKGGENGQLMRTRHQAHRVWLDRSMRPPMIARRICPRCPLSGTRDAGEQASRHRHLG